MSEYFYIAGDWGTTQLRLYLYQYQANASDSASHTKLLDSCSGSGIRKCEGDFEGQLFGLVQAWLDQHGPMPILLSGMVGSTIGWREAPYLSCPADATQIAGGRLTFIRRGIEISILAGLKCQNAIDQPDVMRGEEMQLLGWMHAQPAATQQVAAQQAVTQQACAQRHLVALPGTHNKWAWLKDGKIESFITSYTGELYALLREHSILLKAEATPQFDADSFSEGLQTVAKLGQGQVLHALFTTRSRQLLLGMSNSQAESYLSGLIIGTDVSGALLFDQNNHDTQSPITVIGEPTLTSSYKMALQYFGRDASIGDSGAIATHGFAAIYANLYL
jgi:2-dehydro-3-deoxygalactonokinase